MVLLLRPGGLRVPDISRRLHHQDVAVDEEDVSGQRVQFKIEVRAIYST